MIRLALGLIALSDLAASACFENKDAKDEALRVANFAVTHFTLQEVMNDRQMYLSDQVEATKIFIILLKEWLEQQILQDGFQDWMVSSLLFKLKSRER